MKTWNEFPEALVSAITKNGYLSICYDDNGIERKSVCRWAKAESDRGEGTLTVFNVTDSACKIKLSDIRTIKANKVVYEINPVAVAANDAPQEAVTETTPAVEEVSAPAVEAIKPARPVKKAAVVAATGTDGDEEQPLRWVVGRIPSVYFCVRQDKDFILTVDDAFFNEATEEDALRAVGAFLTGNKTDACRYLVGRFAGKFGLTFNDKVIGRFYSEEASLNARLLLRMAVSQNPIEACDDEGLDGIRTLLKKSERAQWLRSKGVAYHVIAFLTDQHETNVCNALRGMRVKAEQAELKRQNMERLKRLSKQD